MDKERFSREKNSNLASNESESSTASTCACYVNVKDFGALGDGISGDTLAIKNAIASVEKGTLFFPAGTYLVNSLSSNDLQAITLKSNFHVLGSGLV